MFDNHSSDTFSNINISIDHSCSCRDQVSTWLLVHFLFTWDLSVTFILLPVTVLLLIGKIIWIIYKCDSGHSTQFFLMVDEAGERLFRYRLSKLKEILIYEFELISTYVMACWTTELIKGHCIRWIMIMHWIIEASYIPMLIVLATLYPCFCLGKEFLLHNDLKIIYAVVYPSKAILFIIIRYIPPLYMTIYLASLKTLISDN